MSSFHDLPWTLVRSKRDVCPRRVHKAYPGPEELSEAGYCQAVDVDVTDGVECLAGYCDSVEVKLEGTV